jgi:type IV pilus assembly protein PilY1
VTKQNADGPNVGASGDTALNPNNWALSTVVDNIGPVTSSVVHLQNKSKGQLWLYFAAGRYYYEQSGAVDDSEGQRQLFALKDPCYSTSGYDPLCTTSGSFCTTPLTSSTCGSFTNVTTNVPTDPTVISAMNGWYINTDAANSTYGAERVISNPFAIVSGVAFFSSYKPYIDTCSYGGKSNLWAMKYDTGGAPGAIQGVVLLQSSTGSIQQINLQDSNTLSDYGGRRTSNIEGKPPEGDPPPLLSSPPPVNKVIHMRER